MASPTVVRPVVAVDGVPTQVAGAQAQAPLHGFFNEASLICLDLVTIVIGTLIGILTYEIVSNFHWPYVLRTTLLVSIEFGLAFVFIARAHNLYTHAHCLLRVRDTAQILRVSVYSLILLSVGIYFSKVVVPRILFIASWIAITTLLLLQRHLTRTLLVRWRAGTASQRRILIVGGGREARRLFSYLLNSPDLGLVPVAFLDQKRTKHDRVIYSHDYRHKDHAPVISRTITKGLLDELAIDELFVVPGEAATEDTYQAVAVSSETSRKVSFVGASHPMVRNTRASVRFMDGLFITSYASESAPSSTYLLLKRLFDIVVSAGLLVMSLPLWMAIAIWVKLTSPGPVFFRQERVGQYGVTFRMLKFRSMYVDAPEYSRSPEDTRDPRITSAGRFLRKTSLDELPQLLNVLKGDMSLVGPRPEMPYVTASYGPTERIRLSVPQGLTGIWQLSADRRYSIHESMEYDLYYIENRGFFLDVAILLHTLVFAVNGI